MLITVIITAYNRANILKACLKAIEDQTLPIKKYEVVVIDDGSKDNTKEIVEDFMKNHKNIRYFYQENQGQGIARNLGVHKAKGNIVVFIQDDIIVKKSFLAQHLRTHLRHPEDYKAVLGFTDWHPKLEITPFMKWLTDGSSILGKFGGHQFAYEKLKGKKMADFNFFYTSNISLKRKMMLRYPFDPSFSGYGWEDIELGYRLEKEAGLKLYYNPKAVGYHYHPMNENSLRGRMQSIGRSAHVFHKKYPELKKVPPWWKQLVFWLISNSLSLGILKLIRNLTQGRTINLYYYALSKKYFLKGLREISNR
jgi:glycosyltransferase involved in cell wall biosynthesis